MDQRIKQYKRFIFLGITIIALGVVFNTSLKDTAATLGTVLIAVGGLFFIIGMSKKRKEDEAQKR